MNSKALASAVALGLGLTILPVCAHAVTLTETYVQTLEGCTGGCGIDSNNTVVVSDSPGNGVFDILVTLDTSTTPKPWSFQKDPTGKGHFASFGFSDTINGLTFTNVTSGFAANSSNPDSSSQKIAPYVFPAEYTYGVSTASQQVYSLLEFHVDTHIATETLADFLATLQAGTDGAIFAADVFSGNTGKTGGIAFTDYCGDVSSVSCTSGNIPETPIPGALWLFGTVLVGSCGVKKWRNRRDSLVG